MWGNKDKKVQKLINKGMLLLKKGKYEKALKKFNKAHSLDPENKEIYDLLVEAHSSSGKEWSMEDVVKSVGWTMSKQEIENPSIKKVHEMLTPEWEEITAKIRELIACEHEDREQVLIQEIHAYGLKAIYPLTETIIQIKRRLTGGTDDSQTD